MQLGIIGRPLGHSLSPQYFNRKFEALGMGGSEYQRFELASIADLPTMLEANPELQGFNVTIPYKQEVMAYLDEIDPAAIAIGAVNTVKITYLNGKRHLKGYNTDVIGFGDSLAELIASKNIPSALVLGTGGASKAVCYVLSQLRIAYQMVSRTAHNEVLSYNTLTTSDLRTSLLIINTTPLGMSPKVENCPEIDYSQLTSQHLLYDLIYTPEETLFLKKGREYGATTANGIAMWKGQAEAAWKIWNEE